MSGVNKVILLGNVGTEVEMRYTANGSAVSTWRMAVSRTSGQGAERKENTEWFTVVAWNKLAETMSQHVEKGRQIYVEGRLQTRTWDKPDGTKAFRTEVIAENVTFIGARNGSGPVSEVEPDDLPFDD